MPEDKIAVSFPQREKLERLRGEVAEMVRDHILDSHREFVVRLVQSWEALDRAVDCATDGPAENEMSEVRKSLEVLGEQNRKELKEVREDFWSLRQLREENERLRALFDSAVSLRRDELKSRLDAEGTGDGRYDAIPEDHCDRGVSDS